MKFKVIDGGMVVKKNGKKAMKLNIIILLLFFPVLVKDRDVIKEKEHRQRYIRIVEVGD